MATNNSYSEQLRLLVSLLPHVAAREEFALKGGTAINLFVRDLPRLSVDIDLTYLQMQDRTTSLAAIEGALRTLAKDIEREVPQTRALATPQPGLGSVIKLTVQRGNITVKIEVAPVFRGTVHPPMYAETSATVQKQFGHARMKLLAFEELYAGKLCAALDRQHPRDFYDVGILFKNEGIQEKLKNVFLVYLISHSRPIVELLDPTPKDISRVYENEFAGMAFEPVSLEELIETRRALIKTVHANLTDADRRFLLEFKRGEPDWGAFHHPGAENLPAIRWKLQNLAKMDAGKRQQALEKLEKVLADGPRNV